MDGQWGLGAVGWRRAVRASAVAVSVLVAGFAVAQESSPEGEEPRDRAPVLDHGSVPTFHGTTEVVATRVLESAEAAGRREVILTREEIAELPVKTVHELLAIIPGNGLARRGARGVQGDLNLRGSTFEQALVMVNGMRVNNPQTGHHNLDLFLPLASVERVEVLFGSGSALYGPDAFGGAVNIVTSSPVTSAWLRVGENDLGGIGFGTPLGCGLWVAGEREIHSGFRPNTEAEVNQLAAGWSWADDGSRVDVTVSAGERDFGAHRFYSSRFPDQREATAGQLLTARAGFGSGQVSWTAGLRLDRHDDEFILDREQPDWYRNRHRTEGMLLDLGLRGTAGGWQWAAGFEAAKEQIESSNLGDHDRTRGAVFAEAGRSDGPLSYSLQARSDRYREWGSVATWAGGGGWQVGGGWLLRAHAGSSFRAPTFTDLYYTSPSSQGNPKLEPEHGRSFELGVERGAYSASTFYRRVFDLIDYVLDDDGVWRAHNIGEVTTKGLELAANLPTVGRLRWQRAGVVWLDSDIEVDPERSAYALAHPRLELAWSGAVDAGRGWSAGWMLRIRDPVDGGSWSILDCRLGRRILDDVNIFFEASNLFDREVTELHGIPLPGRWLSLSVAYRAGGW